MFSITIPKSKIRNPYAVDASSRKAGKMKDRRKRRESNPKKKDWVNA